MPVKTESKMDKEHVWLWLFDLDLSQQNQNPIKFEFFDLNGYSINNASKKWVKNE